MKDNSAPKRRAYQAPRVAELGQWQHLTQARPSSPGHSGDPKPIGPGRP